MDPDRKQVQLQVQRGVEVYHERRLRAMSVAGGEAKTVLPVDVAEAAAGPQDVRHQAVR